MRFCTLLPLEPSHRRSGCCGAVIWLGQAQSMGGAHGSLTWHASKPSARARSTVRNPPNLHQRLRVTPHGSHTWLSSVTSRIVSRPSDLATSTNLGRSPLRAHRSRGNSRRTRQASASRVVRTSNSRTTGFLLRVRASLRVTGCSSCIAASHCHVGPFGTPLFTSPQKTPK